MICKCCDKEIELERLEILPTTTFCARCANKYGNTRPPKGIMIFDHKTGGTLQTMTEESYNRNKKYYVPLGARSAVKNFSKNVCA